MTGRCPPVVYICLLVAVIGTTCIQPSVSTSIYSNSLLQRGLDACHNQISYCTIAKSDESSKSCCTQCSCRDSCYEKGGCCPDIANATFRFKHSCQSVYYESPQYVMYQDEVPKRRYEMVTKCPDGRECKIDHTMTEGSVSLDDIVVVYNEENEALFQNKNCAKCNGITDFIRWRLIAANCIMINNNLAVLSSEELLRYILDECILFSLPQTEGPFQTAHTQHQCYMDKTKMIDACNVTENWDVYDQNVEDACLDKNLNFPAQWYYRTYKNVYCFMCNNPQNTRLPKICHNNVWDRFTTEFSEVMDLQTDFSSTPDRITSEWKCKDNEIFDDLFNTCRLVICPGMNLFSNGLCIYPPIEINNDRFVYKLNFMLKPTRDVPSNETSPYLDVNERLLRQTLSDVTNIENMCKHVVLETVTVSWDRETRLLHAVYVEIAILYLQDFTVNCTYDNLVKVLNNLKNDTALNISVSVSPGSEENMNFILLPDNRTKMFNSLERLWPNNRSYDSVTLFTNRRRDPITSINVEVPHICPYVMLNESEFCKIVLENQGQSCTSTEFISEYKSGIHTYVYSYENYLNERIERYFTLCLREFEKVNAKKLKPNLSTAMGFLSLTLSCISMACAMMMLLLFCLAKQVTNAPMVTFVSALVNLFIAQGVFQFGSGWTDKDIACQIIGIAVHYFWLATVFSLNAYCVLVLRKILSISSRICSTDFVISMIYIYGFPVLFIAANTIYTNADTTKQISSGYGAGNCHINTALMRGLLFALPILLTVAVNGLINGMIAFKINRIQAPVNGLRKDSRYAAVYFRLLMVTGLTWIFGILKELFNSLVLDYCFSLFVGGQGIMLLISFVCRKHFFQDVLSEVRSRKSSRFLTQTSMSSSIPEKYQNKFN